MTNLAHANSSTNLELANSSTLPKSGASRFFLPAAIALSGVVSADASHATPPQDQYEIFITQSAHQKMPALTRPRKSSASTSIIDIDTETSAANENYEPFSRLFAPFEYLHDEIAFTSWVGSALRSESWISTSEQLAEISVLEDGWDGEGSRAAEEQSLIEAKQLLSSLEQAGTLSPMVGLDSDGVIVLTWNGPDLWCSLSIFGDGTYSYYLEDSKQELSDGESYVTAELSTELVLALTS